MTYCDVDSASLGNGLANVHWVGDTTLSAEKRTQTSGERKDSVGYCITQPQPVSDNVLRHHKAYVVFYGSGHRDDSFPHGEVTVFFIAMVSQVVLEHTRLQGCPTSVPR